MNDSKALPELFIPHQAQAIRVARSAVVDQLIQSATLTFDKYFNHSDESASLLCNIVLDIGLWPNEVTRFTARDDIFLLFIAKLLESGYDNDARALRGAVLLLTNERFALRKWIDHMVFDAFFISLDSRLSISIQNQARCAIACFLEEPNDHYFEFLMRSFTLRLHHPTPERLNTVLSAGAALLGPAACVATQMLAPDFVRNLLQSFVGGQGTLLVKRAFLALLESACYEGMCLEHIRDLCMTWLRWEAHHGSGDVRDGANSILEKLSGNSLATFATLG